MSALLLLLSFAAARAAVAMVSRLPGLQAGLPLLRDRYACADCGSFGNERMRSGAAPCGVRRTVGNAGAEQTVQKASASLLSCSAGATPQCVSAGLPALVSFDNCSIKRLPHPMGAGASAQFPDHVTLDEAKAYAGDAWTDDAQKAFDASASNGTTTKEAIAAYAQEQSCDEASGARSGRTRRSRRRRPSPTWARSNSSHR